MTQGSLSNWVSGAFPEGPVVFGHIWKTSGFRLSGGAYWSMSPAVRPRPHVDVLVHEERDARHRHGVVLWRLVELREVPEPVVPRLPALRVHPGLARDVAPAPQVVGTPGVGQAPEAALVLEPLEDRGEDPVLPDRVDHVVEGLDQPLG